MNSLYFILKQTKALYIDENKKENNKKQFMQVIRKFPFTVYKNNKSTFIRRVRRLPQLYFLLSNSDVIKQRIYDIKYKEN